MTCITVARSFVHTGALVGLLVTCQSFIPALDEDVCLEAPVNWAAFKIIGKVIVSVEIIGKIIGKIIVIIGQIIGNNRL